MMPSFIDPVFIKNVDMADCADVNTTSICIAINNDLPNKAVGAQRINMLWLLYLKDDKSRTDLVMRGLKLDSVLVPVYAVNPFVNGTGNTQQTEKIIIQDLPLHVKNDEILNYLKKYKQVKPTSKLLFGKSWDKAKNNMTTFYTGSRHIFVESPVVPPLPKHFEVGNGTCKLWHSTQNNYCQRCRCPGHKTNDHSSCKAFVSEPEGVLFRSHKDPLSNFYPCELKVDGQIFLSSEQYYQYLKCKKLSNASATNRVMSAKTAAEAKTATKSLTDSENKKWAEHRNEAMFEVLKVKVDQCSPFLDALIDSGSSRLFEATADNYWGIGLDLKFASNTHTNFFPGSNILGTLLEKVRDDYISKDVALEVDVSISSDVPSKNENDVSKNSGSSPGSSYDDTSPKSKNKKRKVKSKRAIKKRIPRYISTLNYTSIDKYLKQMAKKRRTSRTSETDVIL